MLHRRSCDIVDFIEMTCKMEICALLCIYLNNISFMKFVSQKNTKECHVLYHIRMFNFNLAPSWNLVNNPHTEVNW